jgi:O-antigen/teichoic acid export membrane protein
MLGRARRIDFAFWWPRFARVLAGAAGTLVVALTGMIRNKWLAHHLGTSGIGVLAQVSSAQAWFGHAAGMGLSLPVMRAVALGGEEGKRAAWSAAFLALTAGVAITIAGVIAAPTLSQALLGTPDHVALVRISMAGVVGLALWSPLMGFFAGRSDVQAPLVFAVAGGGGATLLAFLLVPRFGLLGGATALTLLYPLGVAGMLIARAPRHVAALWPRPLPFLATVWRESGPLLAVAGAALALNLIDLGTMVGLRAHYLRTLGVDANGLFQAAVAVSQQVGAVFYAYLGSYAFGKVNAVAAVEGTAGVKAYTRRQWLPLLGLAVLAVAASMTLAAPLLHLLYSERFDAARPLLAYSLFGEFGRVAAQTIGIGALAVGGTRLWFSIGVTQPVGMAAFYAWFLSRGADAESLPLAYAAAGWCSFAAALLLLARRGVTLDGRGHLLVVVSFAVLATLARFLARGGP